MGVVAGGPVGSGSASAAAARPVGGLRARLGGLAGIFRSATALAAFASGGGALRFGGIG